MIFPNHQMYYMLTFDYWAGISRIISYDLQTNTLTAADFSVPDFNAVQLALTFNPDDGLLYGIDFDLDSFVYNNFPADLRIVRLNLLDGELTFLTPDYHANLVGSNMALYPPDDRIYFAALQSNPGYIDLGIADISGNTISYETPVYTNGQNMYPTLFGTDIFSLAKDCPLATAAEAMVYEGQEPLTVVFNSSASAVDIHCACQMNEANWQVTILDGLGRPMQAAAATGNYTCVPVSRNYQGTLVVWITADDGRHWSYKLVAVR